METVLRDEELTYPIPDFIDREHRGEVTSIQFSRSVMSISLGPPWTAACQISPSVTNIQDWFPLGLTGLISLQSKGLSRV